MHIIKRGARGMEIVRDEHDRKRFIDAIYFLNDEDRHQNWIRDAIGHPPFTRPVSWSERKPLVDVLGWALLDNHLHMLLRVREDREKGVSEFLHRLFRSMTGHFNEKYGEKGSIFQGPYKSKTVDTDDYLKYIACYVMVKNTFEMYPDGFEKAVRDFDKAWEWAKTYPYSSLGVYMGTIESSITAEANVIHEVFPTEYDFKIAARDMLEAYAEKRSDLQTLQLEE